MTLPFGTGLVAMCVGGPVGLTLLRSGIRFQAEAKGRTCC